MQQSLAAHMQLIQNLSATNQTFKLSEVSTTSTGGQA
jgi:hypothetical protein